MTDGALIKIGADAPAKPGLVNVPSSQALHLYEVLTDDVGADRWLRFRFVAPEIGTGTGRKSFADVEADFEHLCREFVLPYMNNFALEAEVAALSMMDRPLDFGEMDAEVTQYVEVFRVSSGQCIWEGL